MAAISEKTGNRYFGERSVKKWLNDDVVPKKKNREILFELIRLHCRDGEAAQSWIDALINSWVGKRMSRRKYTNKHAEKNYAQLICSNVLADPRLTKLPSLFETNQSLPLATAYVDLCLASVSPAAATPLLLEQSLTLSERLNQRIEARYAIHKSPREILDNYNRKSALILGPPGAGKSSLLRRIALEIAKGRWTSAQIPLFVEVRTYWATRKTGANFDLLTFGLRDILPPNQNVNEVLRFLLERQNANGQQLILLVDGLDEIASDQSAVKVIYSELKRLARFVPWIVTARPAGLMSSLGETHRSEIVGLDEEAIETLIDNWCASAGEKSVQPDAVGLKAEIFGSPSMRDMAQNPFLLTALCFLKSIIPAGDLPTSRIGVYESLLNGVVLQAQRSSGDKSILSTQVLETLQAFTFDLYMHPEGAVQVFRLAHWYKFTKQQHKEVTVDFYRHLLTSRLLTVWEENDPEFHFLHLSLQEHLVARAMLNHPVEDVLHLRFSPAWRAVFRFYGALLWQRGRKEEFCRLTQVLFSEKDFNGLSVLALSEIFATAGIRDTSEWIGEDLRETLYHGVVSGFAYGPKAMIDALALLDPDWLEKITCQELDGNPIEANSDTESLNDSYIGGAIGDELDSPYEKLALVRSGSAKRVIVDDFWGNHTYALKAALVYGRIATPSDRQKIVQKARNVLMFDDMAQRIFTFVQVSLRAEFIPFLARVVEHFSVGSSRYYGEALNLIAKIGGADAESFFLSHFQNLIRCNPVKSEMFEASLRAVVQLGGTGALALLNKMEQQPEISTWHESIRFTRFQLDPSDEVAIIDALSDSKQRSRVITALANAANYGRWVTKENIVTKIRDNIDLNSDQDIYGLTSIEGSRLDAEEPAILCEPLLEMASWMYKKLQNSPDESDSAFLIENIHSIFDTLGRKPWHPAEKLIQTILFTKKINPRLQVATLDLAGRVFADTSNVKVLDRLKEILFQQDCANRFDTAMAIGRIDLEELFRLQSAGSAIYAMEQIAAENDLMIFEKFWVNRFGKCTEWAFPPKKVLHVYDKKSINIPEVFAHEMSQFGLCATSENPSSCHAFLIFSPTEEYTKNLAEQAVQLNQEQDTNKPLFHISMNISEDQARSMAQKIGGKLTTEHNWGKPPR